jgi:hypothetical protein
MATHPVADFLRHLSAKYGVVIPSDTLYRAVLSGLVPASRNDRETRWLIDDADEPVIVEALNIASMPSIASKRQPAAKPKPAAKPASTRPSRSRASSSASAA